MEYYQNTEHKGHLIFIETYSKIISTIEGKLVDCFLASRFLTSNDHCHRTNHLIPKIIFQPHLSLVFLVFFDAKIWLTDW